MFGLIATVIVLLADFITNEPFDIGELQLRVSLFCLFFVFIGLGLRHKKSIRYTCSIIKQKVLKLKQLIINKRVDILINWYSQNKITFYSLLIINLLFFGFYFYNAYKLANSGVFDFFDVFFELDPPRAIDDIAGYSADHYRTSVHPLFVIMVNPLGSFFRHIFQSILLGSIFINSLFGAIGVSLAYLFFELYTRCNRTSLLLAALFGLSTSQFFLSVIPDTASLAIISLIITYIVFYKSLHEKDTPLILWIFAGLFTLGVTTTNVIQTLICYFIYLTAKSVEFKRRLILSFRLSLWIILFASTLSIIQKILYPTAVLFFLPEVYQEEFSFLSNLLFSQPITKVFQLFKTFFFDALIAPIPRIIPSVRSAIPHITFTNVVNYSIIGIIALIILIILYFLSFRNIYNKKMDKWIITGISLCLLFNLLLHSFYGLSLIQPNHIELFLYTGNTTFLILIIISNVQVTSNYIKTTLVLIFIVVMGINNIIVMEQISKFYNITLVTIGSIF